MDGYARSLSLFTITIDILQHQMSELQYMVSSLNIVETDFRPGEGLSEAARAKLYNYPVGKLDVEKPMGRWKHGKKERSPVHKHPT